MDLDQKGTASHKYEHFNTFWPTDRLGVSPTISKELP